MSLRPAQQLVAACGLLSGSDSFKFVMSELENKLLLLVGKLAAPTSSLPVLSLLSVMSASELEDKPPLP